MTMALEEASEQLGTQYALARAMAHELARQHPLPLTARSRTLAEVNRRSQLFTVAALAIFCPIAFAALAALSFSGGRESRSLAPGMTMLVFALIVGIFCFGEYRARKWRGYRDPEIVVDVQEEGVTIRSPDHSSTLRYPDVSFSFTTMILLSKFGSSRVFIGIQLETPVGMLKLDDEYFRPGRIAAAAIALKCA
jgi:hypothetical protein